VRVPTVSFDATISGEVADFDAVGYAASVASFLGVTADKVTVVVARRRALAAPSAGVVVAEHLLAARRAPRPELGQLAGGARPRRALQASFTVTATVRAADTTSADAMVSTLSSATPQTLATELAVDIVEVAAPIVASEVVALSPPPSTPPSPPPPSPLPSPPPSSSPSPPSPVDSVDGTQAAQEAPGGGNNGVVIGIVIGVIAVLALVVAAYLMYMRSKAGATPETVPAAGVQIVSATNAREEGPVAPMVEEEKV